MTDEELGRFEAIATELGMTLSEWVRQALRAADREQSLTAPEHKLSAIRAAVRHSYPAPDIDQMNAEIERGYAIQDPA